MADLFPFSYIYNDLPTTGTPRPAREQYYCGLRLGSPMLV